MTSYPSQGLDAHVEKQLPATQAERQDTLVRTHPQLRYPFPAKAHGMEALTKQGSSLVPTLGPGLNMDRREGLVACDGGIAMVQQHHCPSCSFLGGQLGQFDRMLLCRA